MRILVTGATGFIGNYVIEYLLAEQIEVIATSTSIEKAEKHAWFNKVKYVEYTIGQTALDIDLFNKFHCPDAIIHLAWEDGANHNGLFHIEQVLNAHFLFLLSLIKAGVKNINIVGTSVEYGYKDGRLDESAITNPSTSYGIAKDSLRKMLECLSSNYQYQFKWIRLFNIYGDTEQSPNSILDLLEKAINRGDKEFNMSGGEQLRDFMLARDAAKNIAILSQKQVSAVINCCSGKPTALRNIVEEFISKKMDNPIKINFGFYPYRNNESMAFWGDNSKLLKIISKNQQCQ